MRTLLTLLGLSLVCACSSAVRDGNEHTQDPSTVTSEERSDPVDEPHPTADPSTGGESPASGGPPEPAAGAAPQAGESATAGAELATFGAGCFWCVEAVLEQLDGVRDVASGYMGGTVPDPTYRQVCGGDTGHAEVVQVRFDPGVISYETLLDWFWRLHDPTTLDRQGADIGTQYRSAIFYHSDAQRATAEASLESAQESFARPIVTEITPASRFYVAEEYHQDYYRSNKSQGYCRAVIQPKLKKLELKD